MPRLWCQLNAATPLGYSFTKIARTLKDTKSLSRPYNRFISKKIRLK